MADHTEERRPSPPSGWTAVNGRPSPTAAEAKPPASTSPTSERPAAPVAPMISTSDAPPPGISHHLVEDPALTTSPSTDESATTATRHESPPSPASVVQDGAGPPPPSDTDQSKQRKRSFDGAFAAEADASANGGTEAPARSADHRILPPLQPYPPPSGQPASPPKEQRTFDTAPTSAYALDTPVDPLNDAPLSALEGSNDQDDREMRDSSPYRGESDEGDDGDQSFASPEQDEGRMDGSRTASGVQVDPDRTKRRKRVFSNRTKTGCLTCRKRKKKCDEAHPECNNCMRGGFVCEGYSTRAQWVKPAAKTQPLQSKPSSAGGGGGPSSITTPVSASSLNQHFIHRELNAMDERRLSPPRGSASSGGWGAPPPPPPSQSGPAHGYAPQQHVSPHQHYREPPPPPPPNHDVEHHAPPMFPPSGGMPLHSGHPPPHPNTLPAIQGSIGSGGPSSADFHRPSTARELTERERMLRGEYYLPYTPALMADREQCAVTVAQFNSAANPATGFRFEDRQRIFAQIVSLRPTPDPAGPPPGRELPPDPQYTPNGGVGPGTVVEAPFGCDYGYNISIGRECVIGADVRINDSCSVTIGDNVVFSRGVRLITGTYAIDPKERKKGKGRTLGRSIVIEDDAWLGPECTILPGVRVGRGSTIGAGSLVHKDVPPFTVMAGNPPKVIRGIYEGMASPSRA